MKLSRLLFGFLLTTLLTTGVFGQRGISLLSPFHEDTLQEQTPFFNWYVSDAGKSNGRISYVFVLVKMREGQELAEAVNLNVPHFKMSRLRQAQLSYPMDAPKLERGVWYGWQVQKYWANSLIGQSEPRKFILAKVKEEREDLKYAKLKRRRDGTYHEVVNGMLYFTMEERYQQGKLKIQVYDDKGSLLFDQAVVDKEGADIDGEINLKLRGSNFYELDLGGFNKAGRYELQAVNDKGKKLILPFEVK
ncbi:MAG: hypothetical protein EP338_08975 [Bacteroidetes bacterium]|nr:MAG: hypothetical protein EP338_08975 [Bacteroidota bacterium]